MNLEVVIETHVIEGHPGPPIGHCHRELVRTFFSRKRVSYAPQGVFSIYLDFLANLEFAVLRISDAQWSFFEELGFPNLLVDA